MEAAYEAAKGVEIVRASVNALLIVNYKLIRACAVFLCSTPQASSGLIITSPPVFH